MTDMDPLRDRERQLLERILRGEQPEMVSTGSIKEAMVHWNRGLAVQDEFALLVGWSGRCRLLHSLDETVYVKTKGEELPDFLCVLDVGGTEIAFLVEVKSTQDSKLKLGKNYLDGLERYAKRLGLPILFAYKTLAPLPLWSLTELRHLRNPSGAGKADQMELIKNDLLSAALGYFHVVLEEGTSFTIKLNKEVIEGNSADGYRFHGRVTDVYWQNGKEERVDEVPPTMLWMLMLGGFEEETIDEGDDFLIRVWKNHSGGLLVQWALPVAVSPSKFLENKEPDWRTASLSQEFSFTLEQALADMTRAVDQGLVKYLFHTRPAVRPDWLPT